ncbi:hypothetical protein [Fusobacterium sp. PH5-44]|uniref:hypothetical protein n=1 Tax=unclassified Fusobacterium TaxID=2648384 RepID=UPI003D1A1D03
MKKSFLILMIMLFLNSFGQWNYDESKISKETLEVVEEIIKSPEKRYKMLSATTFKALENEVIHKNESLLYEKLKKVANKEELIELTSHPNENVRSYGFLVLTEDKSVDLLPIVLEHLTDYNEISVYGQNSKKRIYVGDYMISLARLDHNKKQELYISLLEKWSNLIAREDAVKNFKPTENYYTKIKEAVVKKVNPQLLYILASYKKIEDIDLIINELNDDTFINQANIKRKGKRVEKAEHLYNIIKIFPNEKFLLYLEKEMKRMSTVYGDEDDDINMYKSIVIFDNDKSFELLNSIFSLKNRPIKRQKIKSLFILMNDIKYRKPKYIQIYKKLWLEGNQLSEEIYDYLYAHNKIETIKITYQKLQEKEFLSNIDSNVSDKMYKTLFRDSSDLLADLLVEKIKNMDLERFECFSEMIIKMKNPKLVAPLLDRLTEIGMVDDAFIKELIKCLHSYKDDKINKRVREIVVNEGGFDPVYYLNEK